MRVETPALGGITRHDKARVSRVSARAFESGDPLRSDFNPRIFNTAKYLTLPRGMSHQRLKHRHHLLSQFQQLRDQAS